MILRGNAAAAARAKCRRIALRFLCFFSCPLCLNLRNALFRSESVADWLEPDAAESMLGILEMR